MSEQSVLQHGTCRSASALLHPGLASPPRLISHIESWSNHSRRSAPSVDREIATPAIATTSGAAGIVFGEDDRLQRRAPDESKVEWRSDTVKRRNWSTDGAKRQPAGTVAAP